MQNYESMFCVSMLDVSAGACSISIKLRFIEITQKICSNSDDILTQLSIHHLVGPYDTKVTPKSQLTYRMCTSR